MAKRCMGCMTTYGDEFDICPSCGYIENTPAKEAYHMTPGTLLHGKYTVGRVVGYGGFGVTYIGWDNILQQKVAIKEYLPSEFATRVPGEAGVTVYSGEKEEQFSIGCDKFAGEAKRLAQFNSVEGVVEIRDTFRENNTAYIVMEYLEGETLKERIGREGKIPPEEAIEITKNVLGTLEQVHKGDIIHRDISPDNIFLCQDGRIKLLDFGAARYATVQHSKSLSVILKEGYAPEEQYRSRGEQGSWSDVYAMGATLYKMLTGVTPEDAMERAENDKLKPVSKYGVKLSKEVDTALMNALNVFAEDRTQTAQEFKTELEADEVKRKARTRKKIDVGKWPLWSKLLVGGIAIVLVISGWVLSKESTYALEDGKVYVPEVVNKSDEKATKVVEKRNLTLKIIGQEKSEKVEQGKVMTQYPVAGRVVNKGEFVEVKISAGNEVEVVDLSGMSEEEALEVLEAMGFENVEIVKEESAAAAGSVVGQSIEAGKNTDVDKPIKIVVSSGLDNVQKNKTTTVPKLTGMQFDEASEKATTSKIYIKKGESKASSQPVGTIIEQSVKAGSSVKQGTTVTVTISAGEQKVEVPYVEYMSEAEAKRILGAYNLTYSVSYKKSDTVSRGLVMSQSTAAGKKVKPGTKIELVVSDGKEFIGVPSVTGKDYKEAQDLLIDKGFRHTTEFVHSESVDWGKVISATPSGSQEKGTKITLTVSKGTAGKLVSVSEYEDKYSDSGKYSASKRYRYATRSKEYTTSGKSSLSGWTKIGSKVVRSTSVGDWTRQEKTPSDNPSAYSTYGMKKSVEKVTSYRSYAWSCRCGKLLDDKKNGDKHIKNKDGTKGCGTYTNKEIRIYSQKSITNYKKDSDGSYIFPSHHRKALRQSRRIDRLR